MNSSQYLVISLLLFTWLWAGMSSSRDELISVPGNFLAATYMALAGMSSSRDELISVPGNFRLAATYMALGRDELVPG